MPNSKKVEVEVEPEEKTPAVVENEPEAAAAEEKEEEKDSRPEAALYQRSPNPTAVGQSQAVRLVTVIMQQGARYSARNFGIHTMLLPRLHHAAYQAKDEAAFLALVTQYLTEAVGHIPQAARKEDIPVLVGGLQLLIGELVAAGYDGLGLV